MFLSLLLCRGELQGKQVAGKVNIVEKNPAEASPLCANMCICFRCLAAGSASKHVKAKHSFVAVQD